MIMNVKEKESQNAEISGNLNNRDDLALRLGELEAYFAELKRELDSCDIDDIPEETVIAANRSLEWLWQILIYNTPEGIEDLREYFDPGDWDYLLEDDIED